MSTQETKVDTVDIANCSNSLNFLFNLGSRAINFVRESDGKVALLINDTTDKADQEEQNLRKSLRKLGLEDDVDFVSDRDSTGLRRSDLPKSTGGYYTTLILESGIEKLMDIGVEMPNAAMALGKDKRSAWKFASR